MRTASHLLLVGALVAGPAIALPPVHPDPQLLTTAGEPVNNIPTASSIQNFKPLDNAHVMVSMASNQQYLMTLSKQCVGLRWARHIGVTMSDNTIWAGFDNLTADGQRCEIREIHRMPGAAEPEER